jgi:hypothetical protein
LVLLKRIREAESKKTNIFDESDGVQDSSEYGYYFRYPKDKSKTASEFKGL